MHEVLDELDVDYDEEVQLPGHRWRLDFVVTVDDSRWCIEMDGEQHFDPNNYYIKKGGDGAFEKRVAVDREKHRRRACRGLLGPAPPHRAFAPTPRGRAWPA